MAVVTLATCMLTAASLMRSLVGATPIIASGLSWSGRRSLRCPNAGRPITRTRSASLRRAALHPARRFLHSASRLIGHRLRVHLYDDRLECFLSNSNDDASAWTAGIREQAWSCCRLSARDPGAAQEADGAQQSGLPRSVALASGLCPGLRGIAPERTFGQHRVPRRSASPDSALRRFTAQLQGHVAVQAVDALVVYTPAFTAQQHVNAPIAIAHADRRNLFDRLCWLTLPGSTGAVLVGRAFDRQRTVSTPNAHPLGRTCMHIICRCRAGFKTFAESRPAASPCRATDRPRSSLACRSLPRAAASSPMASSPRTFYTSYSRSPR